MRDSEVVASIVAGDPAGLAEAYDRYADALFGYCRSLLREPADAADAVQDTFVIAASRLSGLRDRELLRPWLYAVARNECLRRLKSRETAASALGDDAEHADETADVGEQAERAETRALLLAALGGLNPAERDVVTQLLYGLDVTEIARVLGISRNHAHALFSRARDQLEASVGVLLVARSGRQDCAELDTLLTGWDGQLTVLLRKQVGKHIGKCPVCGERRRRELTPAMLLGLSPAALLGVAAAHGAGGAAGAAAHNVAAPGVAQGAPAALRDKTLRMATSKDLHAEAYRGALRRSHASFGQNGFPKPLHTSHSGIPRVRRGHLAAAVGAVAAVAAAIVLATSGGPHHARFSGGGPLGGRPTGAGPTGGRAPGTAPGGAPGGTPSAVASGGPSVPASPRASVSGPGGPSRSPSPTASRTVQATGTPSPAPSASGTPSPGPTPSRQPTPGTLSVTPTRIVLTPVLGSTLSLTAEKGPVSWSISEPSSLLGELTVAPASGYLAANQSVQVTVTVSGLASLDTHLTVSPGGQQVTVVLGLG
jgi:RNA polymerase sigma factor (sigma-70 family)